MSNQDRLIDDLSKNVAEKFANNLYHTLELTDNEHQRMNIALKSAARIVFNVSAYIAELIKAKKHTENFGHDEAIAAVLGYIADHALSKEYKKTHMEK